jgi:hypothetical protein
MTRRSAWSAMADEWDPERDPAKIRMREALALQPPLSPSRKPRDRRSPSRWRPSPRSQHRTRAAVASPSS